MRAATIALAVAGATAALAQPGAPDRSRVTAGSYQLDGQHSQVLFTVNHLGFSDYTGQFVQPTGTLTLDPAHLERARVEVSFPIAKVSTTVPALDAHLKSADFFDAVRFPEGRFVSTRITPHGDGATVAGDLTLHGVTRPVTLEARFVGAGPGRDGKANVGFAATTTVARSQWGIRYALPAVSDQVRLVINAAFQAQ